MKTTVKKVADVYAFLDNAKYSKMETSERRVLFKALHLMKKVATEFDDFRSDILKRLRPDNAEEISKRLEEFEAMKPEERAAAMSDKRYVEAFKANAEFSNGVSECLAEEAEREVELDFTPLKEDALDRLFDSNPDWTAGQAILAEEILTTKN